MASRCMASEAAGLSVPARSPRASSSRCSSSRRPGSPPPDSGLRFWTETQHSGGLAALRSGAGRRRVASQEGEKSTWFQMLTLPEQVAKLLVCFILTDCSAHLPRDYLLPGVAEGDRERFKGRSRTWPNSTDLVRTENTSAPVEEEDFKTGINSVFSFNLEFLNAQIKSSMFQKYLQIF